MSEAYKKVIREIKRKMFERGMSFKSAAEALGCHMMSIGNYLNYRTVMNADVMIKAIDFFEIDMNQVLGIPHRRKE